MPVRHRALAGVAAMVAAALGWAAPAVGVRADDQGTRTLDAAHQTVMWSGTNPNPTTTGYGPPTEQTCQAPTAHYCDIVRLDVAMPPGSFPQPTDGVLVTIKWASDDDQWNLFVDSPDGLPLASGIDVDSNAQSVLIPQPANGVYTVKVVPFYTTFPQDLTYRATAQVRLDPVARTTPGTPLLPALQTVAPSDFHIADIPPVPSNPTGWRWTPDGTFANSCYLDETVDYGSTRCLRFNNDIRNVGAGPLMLRFRYDTDVVANCRMQQEVEVVGGPNVDRDAGPCVFHKQHAHFHYQNMARYQLYAVARDGAPGAVPVAQSRKVGFCTIDVDDFSFGAPAAAQRPRTYSFPTCNVPNNIPADHPAVWEYMGISAGWGDIYTWDLPAQYIDISSNVPDGVYEVVSRVNPDGALEESSTALHTGVTCVAIRGTSVSVLRSFPSQSNDAPLPRCRTAGAPAASAVQSATSGALTASAATGVASVSSIPDTVPAPRGPAAAALAAAALAGMARTGRRRRLR